MPNLIDLSHPLERNMPVYPGDEPVSLVKTKSVAVDGYNHFTLKTGLHVGTHIDAPLHFLPGGSMVNDLPLDTFAGKGCLLDVRGEAVIKYKQEYDAIVSKGDIVLLRTEHSIMYGKDEYYRNHPVVDEKLADFLIERQIKMLGLDLPSPDRSPFQIHRKLFENNIPILENLTNLVALADLDEFEIIALPLKISAEGCPVRAVAISGKITIDRIVR